MADNTHWGRYHEVSYDSKVEEKILGPFSFSKLAWIIPGVIISYKISQIIPKLPIDDMFFSRIHWLTPLMIAFVFAYFKDRKTNLSLFQLLFTKYKIRKRRRSFAYHRVNMPRNEEEDR